MLEGAMNTLNTHLNNGEDITTNINQVATCERLITNEDVPVDKNNVDKEGSSHNAMQLVFSCLYIYAIFVIISRESYVV